MPSAASVTRWIQELEAGEETALEKLWKRYWPWLVGLARKKLAGALDRAADEEDVAQDVFWSFCRSFKGGHLPRLRNRHDLIALLVVITARKAATLVERALRQKRGCGQVRGESALDILASSSHLGRGIDQVVDDQPSAQEQAMLKEQYNRYLAELPDDLREIAELYLVGYSNRDIARMVGCVRRTVERKLPIIFDHWQRMAEDTVSREEP